MRVALVANVVEIAFSQRFAMGSSAEWSRRAVGRLALRGLPARRKLKVLATEPTGE